jgi:dolichyl-phosphate beta-glucosyltransferase
MTGMRTTAIVIPCYNEEDRLDRGAVETLLAPPEMRLVLVDDGSTDGTPAVLRSLGDRFPDRIQILGLEVNSGKAEAVRRGLLLALDTDCEFVGYADADFATPAEEMIRLSEEINERGVDVVLGARVALLGHDVQRSAVRHYLGRLFATLASLILDLMVYDTQCGAKVMKTGDMLRGALAEPFISRWGFDVELIGRLTVAGATIHEVPLRRWVDVPGSKVGFLGMARTLVDLVRIRWALKRLRARAAKETSR